MAEGADRDLPVSRDVLDTPEGLGEPRAGDGDVVEEPVAGLLDGEDRHATGPEKHLGLLGGLRPVDLRGPGPLSDGDEAVGVGLGGSHPVVELGHQDAAG